MKSGGSLQNFFPFLIMPCVPLIILAFFLFPFLLFLWRHVLLKDMPMPWRASLMMVSVASSISSWIYIIMRSGVDIFWLCEAKRNLFQKIIASRHCQGTPGWGCRAVSECGCVYFWHLIILEVVAGGFIRTVLGTALTWTDTSQACAVL